MILLACGALVACSSGGTVSGGIPLDECPDLDYTTCDTHQAACQTRLLELAACIYGVSAPSRVVPIRVRTEEQLQAELESEPEVGGASNAPDAAALPQLERPLVDLELVRAGELSDNAELAAQTLKRISSLYRNAEQGIVLIDRGTAQDSAEADALLVYELVHALQDARYDLEGWRQKYPSDPDTTLALGTVTDGQATHTQYRAWAALSGTDANYVDWPTTFANQRRQALSSALADESPYLAAQATFPSAFGAVLAQVAWAAEGPSYHVAQFDSPPQTSLEIVSQALARDVPSFDAAPFQAPLASDDYSAVQETVLGAFLLELAAKKLGDDSQDPLAMALAWRGDKLTVYAGPDDQTAWLWQLQLSDEAPAQTLQELAGGGDLTSEAQRDRVFVLGGDDPPQFLLDAGRAFLDAER